MKNITTLALSQDKLASIRLARSENIGKSTFFRLIEIFGSAQEAIQHLEGKDFMAGLRRQIKISSVADVEKELEAVRKFGAEIITFFDDKYPRLLREIPDPAPIITVKGDVDFLDRESIAIVGPRNASFNAINLAKKIALDLGQHSIIVVSGLARGVDCAAHEAAILSGTIAVIGGGIDHVYPRENQRLFEEIAQRGLLVSENPFGAIPKGGNFVQRNRIISGLSMAVIVVEAGLKSGSLVTARFAAEQGREVFSVPGSPFDPRCHGTNRLIKDGAKMFESINDVFDELPSLRARFGGVGILREPDAQEFRGVSLKMPNNSEINKIREEILQKLSYVPIEIEEIVSELQLPTRLVNIAILQLELAERVIVTYGKVTLKS